MRRNEKHRHFTKTEKRSLQKTDLREKKAKERTIIKMKASFEKDRKYFDGKVQKILSKDQYATFQANRKEHQENGFRKDGQRAERKKA